ncbi:hypothetical protein AB0N09_39425 [Streptomyces erythrochromogenes]|uniref:hypothetical protein n=1 Tax=Streptomyces erythrochromogenes TaxID=285574 RepID=UPI0034195F8B
MENDLTTPDRATPLPEPLPDPGHPLNRLPDDPLQHVMGELPLEDRGRWIQTSKAARAYAASQPGHTLLGQTHGVTARANVPHYRTIYNQTELTASLNDPAPLHFAPGTSPHPLTIDHEAAGGTIHLYGGTDHHPLDFVTGGTVTVHDGAVITKLAHGSVFVEDGGAVTAMYDGTCTIRTGGTLSGMYGGYGKLLGGTVTSVHNPEGTLEALSGTIKDLFGGSVTLKESARCDTMHGGDATTRGASSIGTVCGGSVRVLATSHIDTVNGGCIKVQGTTPIKHVDYLNPDDDGSVTLYPGASIQHLTAGQVFLYGATTIHTMTGGQVWTIDDPVDIHTATGGHITLEEGTTLHHAAGDTYVTARSGSTVTLYDNAVVEAHAGSTIIAHGGTVHLHSPDVHLTDHGGATVIREYP